MLTNSINYIEKICLANEELVNLSVSNNYSVNELGCTFKLRLNSKQKIRIDEMLGCVRKVKNNKIAEIHAHNKKYLKIEQYNEFKVKNPNVESKDNPYRYVYPTQGYALSKNKTVDFIGPLQEDVLNNTYKYGKHYLERTPSELYRNSIKDLMQANNKFIADVFNKSITYSNKRKQLRFISKNKYEESLLITTSDKMFAFKQDNNLQNKTG